MDEQMTEQPGVLPAPEVTVYEQLYNKLSAYRFGAIGFLELLDAFEEILHIQPAQPHKRSDVA
jgi:hypothetical protein